MASTAPKAAPTSTVAAMVAMASETVTPTVAAVATMPAAVAAAMSAEMLKVTKARAVPTTRVPPTIAASSSSFLIALSTWWAKSRSALARLRQASAVSGSQPLPLPALSLPP